MVRLGHANLRVRTRALFLADHERDDARQVGLKRQELQVEHQRQVVFEDRRRALRLLHRRQFDVALFLGFLNAALDVANRFGVFVDLGLVLRAELPLEARQLFRHRVQNALVLPQSALPAPPAPCCRCRRTASRTPLAGSIPSATAASALRHESVCV